ncbi:MAG TPA: hypothetical protein VLM89_13060 [Phycisphaerae bacterium]|nr:hypothetical protein [Phycisphaerae bacterium]
MRDRSERAERLLVAVETAPGSGDFRVDGRLCAEEVWQRSDRVLSTARILVRLDGAFDSEEARRRYHPDCRLVVTTADSDTTRREILFEGYPPVQSWRWDGRIGREEESYVFEAEHVMERLARGRASLVFGRRVRTGRIEDGLASDPEGYAGASDPITGLPCVFNPDGVGNRAEKPLTVRTRSGLPRRVHVFSTDDGMGVKWTFSAVLRYLIWFHLPSEGPVFEGNIFEVTDDLAAGLPDSSDPLAGALRREPVSLVCEATSLVEALALLSSAAGIHVTAETANVGGTPSTRLRVWSADGGALRQLLLARGGRHADGWPRYESRGKSAAAVLADNNTYRGEVSWDHRSIVNCPVVIGDVKRYEMTVPLWPGWTPRLNLDNVVPSQRAAARAQALTPEQVESYGSNAESNSWYRRYHRNGSQFKYNTDVARLWVLNEDGHYPGVLYNRNAPFNNYQPFDFSTVADATVTRRGAWMRRRRCFHPTITMSADGRSLGVWVEISFNGGLTWQQQSAGVRVLDDRAGVYFDCENPTEITPTGVESAVMNAWYAIVNQLYRVRVTAVIESDDRLMATYAPDLLISPTLHVNTMVVRRPRSFQFASRSHTTNALSTVGAQPRERDDTESITALTKQLARTNQDRQVRVAPAIPWIETSYALGDRITEIRGRRVRFATARGAGTRYPAVLERRYVLAGGRYETLLTLGITDVPAEAV